MEQLEKVEKLRERANVSYEEAKAALEACNWDLLDAMVYLEKQGKVHGPEKTTWSTSYEEQKQYQSVQDKVQEQKDTSEDFLHKVGRLLKKLLKKSNETYLCINRRGERVLKLPIWAFLLILLCFWYVTIVAIIISLFCECQYSLQGKDNLTEANKVLDKASKVADKVKDEYNKL